MRISQCSAAIKVAIASALWATANAATAFAVASSCTGINVGSASTDDVKLHGIDSNQCVISGVNPQGGPSGDTSGFEGTFGGGWSLLAKIDNNGNISPNPATAGAVNFTIAFEDNANNKTGTWGISTDVGATFDLVFAMHASNNSGAFLFNDFITSANQSSPWAIEWTSNGGQVPNYSNVTLFVRDVVQQPSQAQAVPEPHTYALALSALGMVAVIRRRKMKGEPSATASTPE